MQNSKACQQVTAEVAKCVASQAFRLKSSKYASSPLPYSCTLRLSHVPGLSVEISRQCSRPRRTVFRLRFLIQYCGPSYMSTCSRVRCRARAQRATRVDHSIKEGSTFGRLAAAAPPRLYCSRIGKPDLSSASVGASSCRRSFFRRLCWSYPLPSHSLLPAAASPGRPAVQILAIVLAVALLVKG